MKKIALGIALVMLLTMVFGVFASAVDVEAGKAVLTLELFGLTEEAGDVTYLGTYTDIYPDDEFGVAIRLTTGNVGFGFYQFELSWDPTLIQYVEFADIADGDYLEMRSDANLISGSITINDKNTAKGSFTLQRLSPADFQTTGRTKTDICDAICGYIYFKPISAEAANATISITSNEVKHIPGPGVEPVLLECATPSLKFTLNGGVAERTEPLESLGAKVKTDAYAIRFGADFYNLESKADLEVEDLGMLVVSAFRLGEAELTIGSNNYAVKVQARGIENYKDGWKLEDYDKVTFVATVTDIPASHLADVIVARPYVVYSEGDPVYSAAMYRTYNDVLAAADGLFE